MTTLAVTFYDVVLWLHISAVVVGFGGTFAYGVILATAARTSPRSMPGVIAGISANDRSLVTIGGVLVLVTGIYLAADRWDFSEFFIGWGILAVLVLLGLTHGYFLPNERRARDAAVRDIERAGSGQVEFGPEFNRANAGLARIGGLAGLIIIITVYVMTAKPFL
jgi:hypothetical protein